MSLGLLSLTLIVLSVLGYVLGRRRALQVSGGDARRLHSLPAFYGRITALAVLIPAFALIVIWLLAENVALQRLALSFVAPETLAQAGGTSLALSDISRLAAGLDVLIAQGVALPPLVADPAALATALDSAGVAMGSAPTPDMIAAAMAIDGGQAASRLWLSVAALALAGAALVFSLRRITPELRARNQTEAVAMGALIFASLIAVLTTVGIVFALGRETIHFFQLYPAQDFFLSTDWDPKFTGGSSLGIWPLLWGTLYVSFIALVVAVPVGLMSAIYLSEYASPRLRAVAKPLIEVLAGIPTIVYGLFALVTVGPLLRDYIAQPFGLGDSSSSVMTAGLVMGIMVIPFVSSLSDDIINAVPQSLRDGSLALGATNAETVRRVVIPAALPGIVGAVLLAASRAIGETMIVVLGAGAAAKLSLNPFEAMTTVTVKIVSQLTGDTEFLSPETLVAFALGLTLFTITLGLNVIALIIVRKYREQYE